MLEAQRDLGIDVPDGVIEAYRDVIDKVDLESIAARERITRHDVKARIEEFSALAGHEHIHKGMTSRDLTENVEQLQVKQSLALVRDRAVAALARLGRLAAEHEATVMAGRSHNVAAQATTLGKRFATVANRLPSVVACAATLWLRPAITRLSCSDASRASRARAATVRSRSSSSDWRTWSCSTFSVRSRLVIPLWTCS